MVTKQVIGVKPGHLGIAQKSYNLQEDNNA